MNACYNENDEFAADWLENLVAAGHIAPGFVDRRSILDLTPDDLLRYGQVHLFAGIGIWSASMRDAGIRDDDPWWSASCPCQPFSQAGQGKGFADERHTSLASAILQKSLASRLQARMGFTGSILFRLTWKARVTPSGRPICALRGSRYPQPKPGSDKSRSNGFEGPFSLVPIPSSPPSFVIMPNGLAERLASALRISANVCTGWPTPTSSLADKGVRTHSGAINETMRSRGPDLAASAVLASWPTPTVGNATGSQAGKGADATGRRANGSKATVSLNAVAKMAAWSTPTTRDHKDGVECQNVEINALLGRTAWLASWSTPMAGTPAQKGYNESGQTDSGRKTAFLCGANLAGAEITPVTDWPGPVRITASGAMQSGFTAATESGGQLNSAHSRWLMGNDPVWASCAPTETNSFGRWLGRSSRRQEKL